jgi:hypothetical protein
VTPADTQFLGIVHGGVMLTLMEEAGELHTTRYCSLCGSTVTEIHVDISNNILDVGRPKGYLPVKLGRNQLVNKNFRALG